MVTQSEIDEAHRFVNLERGQFVQVLVNAGLGRPIAEFVADAAAIGVDGAEAD